METRNDNNPQSTCRAQDKYRTIWYEEQNGDVQVCLLDQSLLPRQVVTLTLTNQQQVADAIKRLKVRGAPVIGVTAAFSMALTLHCFIEEYGMNAKVEDALVYLRSAGDLLRGTRPTAVNLAWAVERMLKLASDYSTQTESVSDLYNILRTEAYAIANEDSEACLRIGQHGADLIKDGDVLLTHCNAGALATSGIGTAIAPIYTAFRTGKHVHVYVDETRPVLQGSRLTAWELQQEGVPFTLITDNMAGHFMRHGGIKAVFVGADRIAANGDVANKIGTYGVAVLAKAHAIPFYVVAPWSTIDLSLASGDTIPIEQRHSEEVTTIGGIMIAPEGVSVANPAFDVTPHQYITAIITERGIIYPPYTHMLPAAASMKI